MEKQFLQETGIESTGEDQDISDELRESAEVVLSSAMVKEARGGIHYLLSPTVRRVFLQTFYKAADGSDTKGMREARKLAKSMVASLTAWQQGGIRSVEKQVAERSRSLEAARLKLVKDLVSRIGETPSLAAVEDFLNDRYREVSGRGFSAEREILWRLTSADGPSLILAPLRQEADKEDRDGFKAKGPVSLRQVAHDLGKALGQVPPDESLGARKARVHRAKVGSRRVSR